MAKVSTRMEVEGTLYYPFLTKVNPRAGKYTTVFGSLKEADARALKEAGGNVMSKPEFGGFYIQLKNGQLTTVVDSQANTMTEDQVSKIGSGTTALVKIAIIPGSFANPAQTYDGIQVLKLTEYKSGGVTAPFQKREGYVAGKEPAKKPSAEWEEDLNE